MKKNILWLLLLGLDFSACKKEELNEKSKIETIKIAGVSYPKDSIFLEFEKRSGLKIKSFVFDQEKEKFYVTDYNLYVSPYDYLKLKK